MDTSFLTPLELLFVLCTSDQPINCEEDHPVNIPTKFGSKWQNLFKEENNGRQRGRTPSDGNISPFGELKTTVHSLSCMLKYTL
jgi:hypothetical protein